MKLSPQMLEFNFRYRHSVLFTTIGLMDDRVGGHIIEVSWMLAGAEVAWSMSVTGPRSRPHSAPGPRGVDGGWR